MIEAVLFDLDDTLHPQAAWLDGAAHAVMIGDRPAKDVAAACALLDTPLPRRAVSRA